MAPLLVLIATSQLTLAAFTQTTVFVRTKVFNLREGALTRRGRPP
ncbi:MAG: hypothetical protein AB7O60_08330 [Variibacter sp.]